ncbi:MAG: heavy metal translocating P-type ATPase [Oscillospiraceae bacterium]|nr:heavy metal translocating P-type ATPase [Oscillospiraceae bacterium]
MKEKFAVTGMTCAACSAHVERAVGKLEGVETASVNLMLGSMVVDYDETRLSSRDIIAAVEAGGYGAQRAAEAEKRDLGDEHDAETRTMARRLVWSLVFLVPLFYLGMGHMMGLPIPGVFMENPMLYAVVQLVLTVPILIFNRKYFTVGFSRLFKLAPNMDTLVALGAAAGLVYSLIEMGLLAAGRVEGTMLHLYFESAGMICTLVTVGKYMESRSRGKTTSAISALLALVPASVVVKRDGREVTVPAEAVAVGDTVVVRQGGTVAVDGIVCAGHGAVDESALTGESMPVEKKVGDTVTSATVLRSGYLEFTATAVGEDTTLAQIVRLMEEAASGKAPISRLADKVSGIFVPVVMAIALVAAVLWGTVGGQNIHFSLSVAIAVLVISCPCALGLATPVAIMVGTGKAAEQGILIRSAAALELMGRVKTVVLDKTGTVTQGKPRLTDMACNGIADAELLRLAAAVEQPSGHPLSLAVLEAAQERGISIPSVTDFAQREGGGVSALWEGHRLYGGNAGYMKEQGVDISSLEKLSGSWAGEGKTVLYFAAEGCLLGALAVADTVKADSPVAIESLQQSGHRVVLLTGDNETTARAIAAQVGIAEVRAQVLPEDKAAVVTELQRGGELVAMVGDGVNDAPALVQADVGLAIGAGTDVAIRSADIVLMKSSLTDVAAAADLSRAVLRNIRQNLFWAFFYNAIAIPVAAGALYLPFGILLNPMLGAACMSLSSVCVVSNALRLRSWKSSIFQLKKEENTTNNEEIIIKEETAMKKVMTIEGMMCMHCSGRVDKALNALEGVSATVDLEAKTATVTGDVSDEVLRKTVEDAGYTVVSID